MEVHLARVAVGAGARDPRARARLAVHAVAELGRVRQRGGHDVARRHLDVTHAHRVGAVEPRLVQRLEDRDELVAEPVLEGDAVAVDPARYESTSSCSTFTHSTGPMPPGKTNVSGSENGAVVYQPRSRSQITGGLRHSSIVVQIEN